MTQLVRNEQARRALAEAHSVDEVLQIRDRAEAARAAAKIAGDVEMVNWAAEIRIRAEKRAGELLAEMEKAPGGQPYQSHDATGRPPTLSDLGITKHESSRWQKVAAVPPEEFERYVAETKAARCELTSAAVRKLAKQSLPRQHCYDVGREFCALEDLAALSSTKRTMRGGGQQEMWASRVRSSGS